MKKIIPLLIFISVYGMAQGQKMTSADSLFYSEIYKKATDLRETNLDSAFYYYQRLEAFLADKGYSKQRYRILLDMGNTYLTQGQSDRAMETYLEIAEASELDEDAQYRFYADISIAGIYLDSEDYEKALKRFQKIREQYTVKDSTRIELLPYCVIYNNEGIANENIGKLKEAEELYRKAIKLSEELDEPYYLANAYSNMGSLEVKRENFNKALVWHKKALEIRKESNYTLGICQSQTHIGIIYLKLDQVKEGEEYLQASLESAMQMGYEKQVIENSEALKTVYENREDFEKAYQMQKLEMESRNNVFNEESIKNQERLKAKYEYQLQKQIEEKKREFRETVYKFIFGILLLLLIIAFILFRLQKIKTRQTRLQNENIKKEKHLLHQELDYKNKKLMSNLMFLLQKNEMISGLIEKLREAKKLTKAQCDKALSEMIRQLKYSHNNESWEEFDLYFQEVHSEFYEKLSSNYQLTPNEMKLAAFTKLKLSSKEISSLTGQSIRTIDVGRYRLRKKLGITNSEVNLTTFLNSI
ncbi:tetratricopeptide repeat protein [Christiangramia gaetbulicola]|uniref:Tetratricopeptide repeat protein n=1 Tax=Christiangramia gaetbulicola TaxID=703340 RepID=A0A2T6ANB7_9FLAO|nr:tetratricopeptide repeat protein [Christiangramia gaetbulicola]PTX45314.1 tetratricopeptide repeat protein [Christiangramia gaetbulicola]